MGSLDGCYLKGGGVDMRIKNLICFLMLVAGGIIAAPPVFANNVAVSNVELKTPTASTVVVEFDLSQSNPFGNLTDANSAAFSDYIWVFLKYDTDAIAEGTWGWQHATLTTAGSDGNTFYSNICTGSGGNICVTADGKGAFIKASAQAANLQLVWNYSVDDGDGDPNTTSDKVQSTATARVKVMAIEMVYIPQGQFVYNAGSIGVNSWNNHGGATQITVDGPPVTPCFGNAATDCPNGAQANWPNGFNAFYVGKYEVSQGQYADFLNTISATNGTARYLAQTTYQYTITYTGGNYAASSPNRACNFLSWDDTVAYLDWAALRPMTEMEFEKSARGGGTNTNTYPWGTANPDTGNAVYLPSGHSSPYNAWSYYADYCDPAVCANDVNDGPTNVGNYLSGDLARSSVQTGASPYGVADMTGNVWEHLINCNSTTTPANGDGNLAVLPASWPGWATGKGIRGGSWNDSVANGSLRVSDRSGAEWAYAARSTDVGFRPARTP